MENRPSLGMETYRDEEQNTVTIIDGAFVFAVQAEEHPFSLSLSGVAEGIADVVSAHLIFDRGAHGTLVAPPCGVAWVTRNGGPMRAFRCEIENAIENRGSTVWPDGAVITLQVSADDNTRSPTPLVPLKSPEAPVAGRKLIIKAPDKMRNFRYEWRGDQKRLTPCVEKLDKFCERRCPGRVDDKCWFGGWRIVSWAPPEIWVNLLRVTLDAIAPSAPQERKLIIKGGTRP